ncbi:MAG: hypothetical protein NT062_30700 [Proteobacteria bacterium]|nr:hypothetical protein [Pseudomonadota bacterium]
MTEATFWRQIGEAPDDPAIREVYADWLLARGQRGDRRRARALQHHARSGLPLDPISAPYARYTPAQRQALDARPPEADARWRAVLKALGPIEDSSQWGGLPYLISYQARDVVRAEALIAATSFTRTGLRFTDHGAASVAAEIAASGVLRHVRALDVIARFQEIDPEERGIELRSVEVGDEVLAGLCAAPSLAPLEVLSLAGGGVTTLGARALANGPFTRLRWLRLSSNPLLERGGVALAAAPTLRSVEHLDVSGCHLGAAGAWAIARSQDLPNLATLDLSDNGLTQEDKAALRGVLALRPCLRSLVLDPDVYETIPAHP